MFAVLTCIFEGHDLRLVLAAAVICATACSAAFGFHLRSLKTRDVMQAAWLALTGVVAGCGVWATHFIAMLAYQPSQSIGYEPFGTAASLGIAVLGMGLGFALPVLARGRAVRLAGGALTGLSVAAMHFTGMTAVRVQAVVEWDWRYVAASVVIGALGAMAAFEARSRLTGRWAWAGPAGLLVLAIVGLHFTAMTAVSLTPDPRLALPAELIGRGVLAAATAGLAALIFGAAGSLFLVERMGQKSSLSNLRGALDVVPAGLAFFDPGRRLLYWNRALGELMGGCDIDVEEGRPLEVFIAAGVEAGWEPVGDGDHAERWNAHQEGRPVPTAELRLPDGRRILHEAFPTPDGGEVVVMTDVTEQREGARVLAEARDAALAANRAKSEFLANMSHEIRTPLNGMLGVAEVLTRTKLSARQRELVGVLQASGVHLDGLLADILDLARVEAGAVELRPQPVDLGALASSVRDLFAGRAEEKALSLRLEIGPGAGDRVACDPLRLRQVLGNLVSNAVKFTGAGEVVLTLSRRGDLVRFEVRDTGEGFDEALKMTLFQRFRQADNTATRAHGGTGLGLAICDEYVRLMGGQLDCESRPGEGSLFEFTLELPALQAEQPEAAAKPEEEATAPLRVLVVDDNPVNRQVLQLILESAGIESEPAENGKQGVEAFERGDFDVVLMDIQMPVMDGFEATRRIRASERSAGRPRTPLYIVSANCLQEHVDAGRAAGADGHFNKPIAVPELLAALQPHRLAKAA